MIYFDNSSTSYPKPLTVRQEIQNAVENFSGNGGRGSYKLASDTAAYLNKSRQEIADFLGIPLVSHLIFTSGCTESCNGVISTLLQRGDTAVYSGLEHNATWRPLKAAERRGAKLNVVENPVDLRSWERAITPKTKLVVVNHGSNINGTISPVKEISAIAHKNGVPILVDFAQTAGLIPINITEIDCDYGAFAGHKGLLGLGGTGLLYIKKENTLTPWRLGGTGTFSHSPYQKGSLPEIFEAGTKNTIGVGSLKGGVNFLNLCGVENIRRHEENLTQCFLSEVRKIPNITVYEPFSTERLPVVSLNIGEMPPLKAAKLLEQQGEIAVRFGLHCSGRGHRTIGTLNRGTVRFSFGYGNTISEVEKSVECLRKIARP